MKVGRLYREKIIKTIQKDMVAKTTSFVVNYHSVPTSEISALRKSLQQKKAKMYVSRASLAKIALKDATLAAVMEKMDGHTAFVSSDADPVDVAKVLVKFAEKNQAFVIRGGVLGGALVRQDEIKRFSELPAKEVLIAQLLGTLNAPMTRLARVLNGKTTELILILKQLSEKRGGN